jgi:hypothetical protein
MTTREEAEAKVHKNSDAFVNTLVRRLGRSGVDYVMKLTVEAVVSGKTEQTRALQISDAVTTLMITLLAASNGEASDAARGMVHRVIDVAFDNWHKELTDAGYQAITADDQAALASEVPEGREMFDRMDVVADRKH